MRVPISDVYNIAGIGTISVGSVDQGVIKPGMNISIAPGDATGEVASLQIHKQQVDEGKPGDYVGFHLKDVDFKKVKRGYVASDASNDPAKAVESFDAQVIVIYHPDNINKGYTPVIGVHTAHVPCKFEELL